MLGIHSFEEGIHYVRANAPDKWPHLTTFVSIHGVTNPARLGLTADKKFPKFTQEILTQ